MSERIIMQPATENPARPRNKIEEIVRLCAEAGGPVPLRRAPSALMRRGLVQQHRGKPSTYSATVVGSLAARGLVDAEGRGLTPAGRAHFEAELASVAEVAADDDAADDDAAEVTR